ncbi:hypothetical protein C5L28_001717 [Lentilactobacillus parakefiri]|uniref:Uncharacterized protein n=1 Tax=Lentilactobacillus parakefiri TaxID=152332 RepID=A0AB38JXE1_9LACO|nr:hypothetical protein C5L28_001717 [Lentilactobacillus parakefiri]
MVIVKKNHSLKTQLSLFEVFCGLVLICIPFVILNMNTLDQIQYYVFTIMALYFWSGEIMKLDSYVPAYKIPLLMRNICVVCLLLSFAYSLLSIIISK